MFEKTINTANGEATTFWRANRGLIITAAALALAGIVLGYLLG